MKTVASQKAQNKTPRELGYQMPAEWTPHEAIWLSWPHDPVSFPKLDLVEKAYVQIISSIHTSEEVRLFVVDEAMRRRVDQKLKDAAVNLNRVRFFVQPYADVWFRDYGPTFVLDQAGKKAMVHWIFNAWGGKYETLMADTKIPERILKDMPMPCFKPGIVLEGGSIDVNGQGTVLTTQQCLLNKNRNPKLNRTQIEKYLTDFLGTPNVIWLKEGIVGDDTDGHIDDIARFVSSDTVICAIEENKNDPNYEILRENHEILKKSKDQDGRPLKVITLPMPGVVGDENGRLPASYANFYIGNNTVLVPIFGHSNDARALEIMRGIFPQKKVVGIRCENVVQGLGTIHCISQQEPARP